MNISRDAVLKILFEELARDPCGAVDQQLCIKRIISRVENVSIASTLDREVIKQHRDYAHMMQTQRSQIADYCRTLERQIEALAPKEKP